MATMKTAAGREVAALGLLPWNPASSLALKQLGRFENHSYKSDFFDYKFRQAAQAIHRAKGDEVDCADLLLLMVKVSERETRHLLEDLRGVVRNSQNDRLWFATFLALLMAFALAETQDEVQRIANEHLVPLSTNLTRSIRRLDTSRIPSEGREWMRQYFMYLKQADIVLPPELTLVFGMFDAPGWLEELCSRPHKSILFIGDKCGLKMLEENRHLLKYLVAVERRSTPEALMSLTEIQVCICEYSLGVHPNDVSLAQLNSELDALGELFLLLLVRIPLSSVRPQPLEVGMVPTVFNQLLRISDGRYELQLTGLLEHCMECSQTKLVVNLMSVLATHPSAWSLLRVEHPGTMWAIAEFLIAESTYSKPEFAIFRCHLLQLILRCDPKDVEEIETIITKRRPDRILELFGDIAITPRVDHFQRLMEVFCYSDTLSSQLEDASALEPVRQRLATTVSSRTFPETVRRFFQTRPSALRAHLLLFLFIDVEDRTACCSLMDEATAAGLLRDPQPQVKRATLEFFGQAYVDELDNGDGKLPLIRTLLRETTPNREICQALTKVIDSFEASSSAKRWRKVGTEANGRQFHPLLFTRTTFPYLPPDDRTSLNARLTEYDQLVRLEDAVLSFNRAVGTFAADDTNVVKEIVPDLDALREAKMRLAKALEIVGSEPLVTHEAIEAMRSAVQERGTVKREYVALGYRVLRKLEETLMLSQGETLLADVKRQLQHVKETLMSSRSDTGGEGTVMSSIRKPADVQKDIMEALDQVSSRWVACSSDGGDADEPHHLERLFVELSRSLQHTVLLSKEPFLREVALVVQRADELFAQSARKQLIQAVLETCSEVEIAQLEREEDCLGKIRSQLELVWPGLVKRYKAVKDEMGVLELGGSGDDDDTGNKLRGLEKIRLALLKERNDLQDQIQRLCLSVDMSGSSRCAFPEMYYRVTIDWEREFPLEASSRQKRDAFKVLKDIAMRTGTLIGESLDEEYDFDEDHLPPEARRVIDEAHDLNKSLHCALHRPSGKVYFLKGVSLHKSSTEETIREVQRAILHSRIVRHPNILPCDGLLIESDRLVHLRFAFQSGGDLAMWMSSSSTPIIGTRLDVLAQVASALESLHEKKIFHRDIKPQNIVMSASGVPLLTDFEYSKMNRGVVTNRTVRQVGTPGFMAPEIVRNPAGIIGDNWARCDVYSFAATCLWTLAFPSSSPDFDPTAPSIVAMVERTALETFMDADNLVSILQRSLSEDPSQRPTMTELARVLRTRRCFACQDEIDHHNGVMCPSGRHFICREDLEAFVLVQCKDPEQWTIRLVERERLCVGCPACLDSGPVFSFNDLKNVLPSQTLQGLVKLSHDIVIKTTERLVRAKVEEEYQRALLGLEVERLKKEILRLSSNRCPKCMEAWDDYSACAAVTCAFPLCKANFCGLCCAGPFENSRACHQHVANSCEFNPNRGEYHVGEDAIRRIHRERLRPDTERYLMTLSPELQQQLKQDSLIKMRLDRLGL